MSMITEQLVLDIQLTYHPPQDVTRAAGPHPFPPVHVVAGNHVIGSTAHPHVAWQPTRRPDFLLLDAARVTCNALRVTRYIMLHGVFL